MHFIFVFLLLISNGSHLAAYYLPGVTPESFEKGDSVSSPFVTSLIISGHLSFLQVILKANKVTSTKTPLQYDYYDLPFCKTRKNKAKADNIGESLSGDSVTTSPYMVRHSYILRASQTLCSTPAPHATGRGVRGALSQSVQVSRHCQIQRDD
jgi:hypothetical protein